MAESKHPKIFISYRRQDSEDTAGRLKEKLSDRFGEERVFFDVDSIPVGVDFRRYLEDAVSQCDVFLALIGRDWLTAQREGGGRCIDDPADFVRIEIESAFSQGITVIPVLVRRAVMPQSSELPEGLKELAFRNGAPTQLSTSCTYGCGFSLREVTVGLNPRTLQRLGACL